MPSTLHVRRKTQGFVVYVGMRLLFFLANLAGIHAQLLSHSILHHIDRGTLAYYNLTHPDDTILRTVRSAVAKAPQPTRSREKKLHYK